MFSDEPEIKAKGLHDLYMLSSDGKYSPQWQSCSNTHSCARHSVDTHGTLCRKKSLSALKAVIDSGDDSFQHRALIIILKLIDKGNAHPFPIRI